MSNYYEELKKEKEDNVYNYYEEVEKDLINYINENTTYILENVDPDSNKIEQFIQAREYISDNAWIDNSVTGYRSGSYTFNSHRAKVYVLENLDLLERAAKAFEMDCNIFLEKWETWDSAIRCYILGICIDSAIDNSDLFK